METIVQVSNKFNFHINLDRQIKIQLKLRVLNKGYKKNGDADAKLQNYVTLNMLL